MWRNTDNSLRPRWRFLALIGLPLLLALAQTAPPAQPFQRLDGCIYKPQRWNDGDSFHVLLRDQKEVIFRLYFVDTPEEERVYADRIAEQAAYFGISADAALEVANEASEFTKRTLAKPFTTYTRWRRALGRSAIWRYFAIVVTVDGHDLNELLVSNGLARIYGTRTPLPDSRDSRTYLAHLRALETQAKAARRGAWGKSALIILGNHRRQSQQSWMELGLSCGSGSRRANNLDCRRASRRRKALRCARR
jgi:endonuclease YncB( thermonuclease family)